MIPITARPILLGEIIILNVGWRMPESYRDQHPSSPLYIFGFMVVFGADPLGSGEPAQQGDRFGLG